MDKKLYLQETLDKILRNPLIFNERETYDNIRNIDNFLNVVIDLKIKRSIQKNEFY